MERIKVAIVGYGNLGKGVEKAIGHTDDMELVGVFSRRDPNSLDTEAKAYRINELVDFKEQIDVCILCGGSATDLINQGPELVKDFNIVDSFDTHAKIPEYFEIIDKIAKENGKIGLISTGWDPGLFSINRILSQSILSKGETYTFWGKGVSQGHSDAIRRIQGVIGGIQYTIPNEEVIRRIIAGEKLELTTRDKHLRECFVVVEDGADKERIKQEIVTMPNYFSDYDTIVNFISMDELKKNHSGMPHGGKVLRIGTTGEDTKQVYEFSLELGSNPEFTASVNVAYARAVSRLAKEGNIGAMTVFDIAPKYLSSMSDADQRRELL